MFYNRPVFSPMRLFAILVPFIIVVLGSGYDATSADLTLNWTAPSHNWDGTVLNNLAGYRVYYGPSGQHFTNVEDVGNVTAVTLIGLDPDKSYDFAITAYNTESVESPFSSIQTRTALSDPADPTTPTPPPPVILPWDAGFQQIGNGWRRLNWLGDYIPMGNGWTWHNQHGFIFPAANADQNSIWFFAPDMGWLWTNASIYPSIYRAEPAAWLWYNGATSPRWFFNLNMQRWESHQ